MSAEGFSFLVVCEDHLAWQATVALGDPTLARLTHQEPDAMGPPVDRWRGLEGRWLATKDIGAAYQARAPRAGGFGRRMHGRFDGKGEERQVREAIAVFARGQREGTWSGLVFLRDDDHSDRERAIGPAIEEHAQAHLIAHGVAKPETEAWLLAGAALSDDERLQLRRDVGLGFDPVAHPERLTSTNRGAADCKAVARRVIDVGDGEQVAHAIRQGVDTEAGTATGLRAFAESLETMLEHATRP